jgi:hypothetical protein
MWVCSYRNTHDTFHLLQTAEHVRHGVVHQRQIVVMGCGNAGRDM